MAAIRPFQGLRFSAEAGPIDSLTAPPYDVLSPAEREEYAVRNDHNIVHLTLPEQLSDDRSKFVKYARSAAKLAEWRRDGTLIREDEPALYRYTQRFHLGTDLYERTSVVVLVKVEPYAKGVVLPHEETFPKHKEDRLRILEATRAHLECIYGLVEDPTGDVVDALREANVDKCVVTRSDEGVEHTFEPITDKASIDRLTQLLDDKKIWIADGHHRYETAVSFREMQGEKSDLIPEDFMMIALSSMSDPGLVLLPTHRIVRHWNHSRTEVLAKLGQYFDISETHSSRLMEELNANLDRRTFALTFEGSLGYVLRSKDDSALLAAIDGDMSDNLRGLDVTVLHRLIFDQILGLPEIGQIEYTRDANEAVREVNEGAAAAFLMRPPTVEDMKSIALGGEKMPQKSTYYYPKILSGLVVWSLNDF
jgi:uncharacterized protein (DUF1015 family)